MGQRIFEDYWEFDLTSFEGINGQLVIFLRLPWHIENGRTIDENSLIFDFKVPGNIEPLRCFQPIFDGNVVNFMLLGFAVNIISLCDWGRRGWSHETIHQSWAIRYREEQRSRVFLIFYFWNFLIFGHGQRVVDNLIVSLGVGIDFNKLFSPKIIKFSFIANRCFDFPWLGSCIFECDLLSHFFPHHAVEF